MGTVKIEFDKSAVEGSQVDVPHIRWFDMFDVPVRNEIEAH